MAQNNMMRTGIILVVLVVVLVGGSAAYEQFAKREEATVDSSVSETASGVNANTENVSVYENGTYTAIGSYISPGGAEEVGVTVTLSNGVIVDSEVEILAEREISVEKQQDFADHYKPEVVGKRIDEVELTKISGSSLTPQGFNDALEQIKAEAQS